VNRAEWISRRNDVDTTGTLILESEALAKKTTFLPSISLDDKSQMFLKCLSAMFYDHLDDNFHIN
jgi:hypothetical protein